MLRGRDRSTNHPKGPDYLVFALNAMVVSRALIEFLDKGKPIPVADPTDPRDAFLWAVWVLKGDIWDRKREGISFEDRRFLESALAQIKDKPTAGFGSLFRPPAKQWTADHKKLVAETLLEFFGALQEIANGASNMARSAGA
jgi:hypothetical protein